MHDRYDYVLVGGGLQNALIALALRAARPGASIALVERGETLGGNHLWCFHSADVPADARAFVEPLIVQRWAGYDVHFPAYSRRLEEPYAAVSSEHLSRVVQDALAAPHCRIFLGTAARRVGPHEVVLEGGGTVRGAVVIDARGPEALARNGAAGYQKFVGVELELPGATAPTRPTVMDARVPQVDGFRFVYVLPLSPTRVLVEDTVFSDDPHLDVAAYRASALAYARAQGLEGTVLREERGVLPLSLRVPELAEGLPLRAGYQGGWFHPTTGYSFPTAVRLARHVAATAPGDLLGEAWSRLARGHRRQLRYAVLLNQLLFGAYAPDRRVHVFEHFYRLGIETVRRFYALQLTWRDQVRILSGGPPKGLSVRRFLRRAAPAPEASP